MCNKKNKAMSFAELVLVMTIIGVIASLGLPSLKKYSQRAEFARLAQKAYYSMEEAIDGAVIEHGPIKKWDFSEASYQNFVSEYITSNMKYSGGVSVEGMTFSTDTTEKCDGTKCTIVVDVNADASPNQFGKDKFKFVFNKEGQLMPHPNGVEFHLSQRDWKFSDNLWNCATAANYDGSCSY